MEQCYLITTTTGFQFIVWANEGIQAIHLATRALYRNPDWWKHEDVKTVKLIPMVLPNETHEVTYWGIG